MSMPLFSKLAYTRQIQGFWRRFLIPVDKLLGNSQITFILCYRIFFMMLAVVKVFD